MGLLTTFETEANFWKLNPQLLIPEPLAKLYKQDKSKDKNDSSRIMWAICLYIDPSEENKFRNFPEKDRKELIISDYLQDSKFKFESYKDITDWYSKNMLSNVERALISWRNKLTERETFIMSTVYTLESADALDKIMANTDKLFNQLERVEKQYVKEQIDSKDKGGKEASLSDKGLI